MAFATAADVAIRLQASALSAEETAAAEQLILFAQAVIADAAEKDDAWAAALPELFKGLAITLVCRAMASPQGLRSASETLGQFSRSENYGAEGMLLTDMERGLVRKALNGTMLISPRTPPIDDSYYPPELDPFFLGS